MKRVLLEKYVGNLVEVYQRLVSQKLLELAEDGFSFFTRQGQEEFSARIYEVAPCLASGDFKHGTVYPFVMDPVRGTVYFNGLDFDLHGAGFSLKDPDPIPNDQGDIEPNILSAFQKALTDGSGDLADLKHGASASVKYHWDNPLIEEDDVEDYISMGVVPGTSIKESYLQIANLLPPEVGIQSLVLFGSGIYPDVDDDGGCVIASVDNATQGALLNLFLIASVLFSVVFLRKRV